VRRLVDFRAGEAAMLGAASFLLLMLLVDVVSGGLATRIDESVIDAVAASNGGPAWVRASADLGGLGISGAVVAIGTLVCAQQAWRLWPIVLTSVNLALVGAVVMGLKTAVQRTAPPTAVSNGDYAGYFPSGHTATAVVCFGTAAFLAAALLGEGLDAPATVGSRSGWDRAERVAVGVGLTVGVVVGLGTVMKGNHWPTDVVGGLLVGFVALVTGVAVVRTQVSRRAGVRR